MTPEEFKLGDVASSKHSNGKRRVFVDELNGIRTALYSDTHLALDMSAYSHPSQQLDPTVTTYPSSTETSSFLNSSADEDCKSTLDSHLTLEPTFCSSLSHRGVVDCPLPLSSNCGELNSALNSVDTVSTEISQQSNYTCSSQQLASSSVLPLLSTCEKVTINGETQNETGQLEEVENSIQLGLSDCSFSSQREIADLAPSQLPDSHGISCMDDHERSVQVEIDRTGLPMKEPINSALVTSDHSEQSFITSNQSDPFISGNPQQSNTESSCKANDTSALPSNHSCSSKSRADTNDQGQLSSKETNDPCQGSALNSEEKNDPCLGSALSENKTNDQCQGSALSSKETNDPRQGSALSSEETNDPCLGSALSENETNDPCQGSALSSKETNDQCQGSPLSSKETNDPRQGSAMSSKESNDPYLSSALSSKETNDPCQGSARSSRETNDQCLESTWSRKDSSCKLYNFSFFFNEDEKDAADCIFDLLEQKHHLRGFKNGRDDTPGTYKSDEAIRAIENSEKILLLLTSKSVVDKNFEFLIQMSLRQSIESGNTKLIPIRFGIQHCQIPTVLRSKYCLNYDNFSGTFQDRLSGIFHPQASLTSSVSKLQLDSHPASPTCSVESESSTRSSDSPKFRQYHSVPSSSTKKKPWYTCLFSSPK